MRKQKRHTDNRRGGLMNAAVKVARRNRLWILEEKTVTARKWTIYSGLTGGSIAVYWPENGHWMLVGNLARKIGEESGYERSFDKLFAELRIKASRSET